MVAVAEADGLGLRAALEHGRAAEFQVFDEDDAVAVGEHVAVGVLDHARAGGRFRRGFARPFVAAGDAFPFIRMVQNLVHLAQWAG